MSELQFKGAPAERVAEHLMTETDAKDRLLSHQPTYRLMCVWQRARIARAIGEEVAVRIQREHLFRRCLCRNNRDAESLPPQTAQDVFFDAVIVGDNLMPDRRKL